MVGGRLARQAAKSGSSDSATFMRKVPEPQRQRSMRSRNSAGSAAGLEQLQVQQLRVEVGDHGRGAKRLAGLGHRTDRTAALDQHLAHRRSTRISTPRAAADRAIAWVIAPMPPMAWPQAPLLPFTSPNTWCSST